MSEIDQESMRKLKALFSDNYACVAQPAWHWNCNNCPIGKVTGDLEGSCADGRAQQSAIAMLSEVDELTVSC